MNMKQTDALSILGIALNTNITPHDSKMALREAEAKYHPDHNPAGMKMMQLVHAAYQTLKNYTGPTKSGYNSKYGEVVNQALNAIKDLGLEITVCGSWLWIRGNTKPYRTILREAGFVWASGKGCWYMRPPGQNSNNHKPWLRSKIHETYGTVEVAQKHSKQFSADHH